MEMTRKYKFRGNQSGVSGLSFIATMPSALKTIVDIELLIEGRRSELFQKLISQVPPIPSSRDSLSFENTPGQPSSANHSNLSGHPPISSGEGTSSLEPHNNNFSLTQGSVDHRQKQVDKTSYEVRDYYLKNDRSECTLRVKYLASEYYYYIFKFNGYVVCPAFLYSRFKLAEYACLDANHGRHLYIFLDSKVDDPLSNLLDDPSLLCGRYSFEAPTPFEKKVFILNPRNMNLKCFFNSNEMLSNIAFQIEHLNYRLIPSKDVQRLNMDSSYRIVPLELKERFKTNHRILFSPLFDFGDIAIVHKDSRSFLEIEEYTKMAKSKEEEIATIGILKNAFETTDYKREAYIMAEFVKHIQSNYEKSGKVKTSGFYCSMIAILQSSGYGKSKLMERLGSRTPTFYSSLLQGSGFPSESFFLSRLIRELDRIVLEGILGGSNIAMLDEQCNHGGLYLHSACSIHYLKKHQKHKFNGKLSD